MGVSCEARAWGLAAGLAVAMAGAGRAQTCPSSGSEAATVAAVESRLELRLADGRLVRLAGIDPAQQTPGDPDLAETARQHLATDLAGKPISLTLLTSGPDRWGRRPAFAFRSGDPEGGIAAVAIAAGLGRFLAEPAAQGCRDVLLAPESRARAAKLGLWADPYYAVLAVDDQAAFAERSGTIVVAEGRVVAVEPGPYRTKLRFAAPGPQGRHVLAAAILPHVMKAFEAKGVTFQSLIGRRLRLRGLLDLRFGPQIELAGPDDVEVLPPDDIPPLDSGRR